MGWFDFFKRPSIDQGVEEYHSTHGAVLLDVRTPEEYRQGHIPTSRNIPLHTLQVENSVPCDKNTPLFVYCQSGVRSRQAVAVLGKMGYTDIRNIGGIAWYTGKVER